MDVQLFGKIPKRNIQLLFNLSCYSCRALGCVHLRLRVLLNGWAFPFFWNYKVSFLYIRYIFTIFTQKLILFYHVVYIVLLVFTDFHVIMLICVSFVMQRKASNKTINIIFYAYMCIQHNYNIISKCTIINAAKIKCSAVSSWQTGLIRKFKIVTAKSRKFRHTQKLFATRLLNL